MFPKAFWPNAFFPHQYWPGIAFVPPPTPIPCAIPLSGTYVFTISLTGSYNPPILLTGSYVISIPLVGGCMSVTSPPVEMYVGEDKNFPTTIYEADGITLQDITGWSITATIHQFDNPLAVVLTKTVGSGIVLTNPTQGLMTISLLSADTINVNPGSYQLRIERTDSGFDDVLTLIPFTLLKK